MVKQFFLLGIQFLGVFELLPHPGQYLLVKRNALLQLINLQIDRTEVGAHTGALAFFTKLEIFQILQKGRIVGLHFAQFEVSRGTEQLKRVQWIALPTGRCRIEAQHIGITRGAF